MRLAGGGAAASATALLLSLAATACVAQPASDPQQDGGPPWDRYVADLAPVMRACLAGAPPGSAVVIAWPMNHGMALARVRRPDGTREDCVAEMAPRDARVDSREPVAEGDRLPGEDVRRFTLERGCVDARRVDGAEGEVLGWLGYPGCG